MIVLGKPGSESVTIELVREYEEIQLGDVLAHVTVRVGESVIESVMTRRSAAEMALTQGDSVTAVVKATGS